MKLLIITQVVDKNHVILGFFHRWILEFAKHASVVHVIALQVGEYDLPGNVVVHSLGKEGGESKPKYLWRFYAYCWSLRNEYDTVFVHMNQIYVILGGLLWWLFGKRVGLWYAHGAVSNSLKLATAMTDLVFTSTPQGFQLETPKLNIVGQGIDMSRFAYSERQPSTDIIQLITVGRISVSKQIDTLLQACVFLKEQGIQFNFRIVGAAATVTDQEYESKLRAFCTHQGIADDVIWHGPSTQTDLPALLKAADIFIHDGVTNSLDKVLVEAVASGVPTISSNPSYRYILGDVAQSIYFTPGDATTLALHIQTMARLSLVDKNQFTRAIAERVQQEHSLPNLISGIVGRY